MDPSHPFATTFFFKRPGQRHGFEHDVFMVRDLDDDTGTPRARDRVLRDLIALRRGAPSSATVLERKDDWAAVRWTFEGKRGSCFLTIWLGSAADRVILLGMLLHSEEDAEALPEGIATRLETMREDAVTSSGSSLKELIENPEHAVQFDG